MTGRLRLAAPLSGLTLLAVFAFLWSWDRPLYFSAFSLTGLAPLSYPFADWDSVSQLVDCWRRGVSGDMAQPCGVGQGIFSYSPLWLEARFIPFDPAWRNAIGLGMDASFLISLGFVFRPETRGEAALFTLTAISPIVAYACERANVDLILFVMVVAAGVLAQGGLPRRIGAYAVLLFAGLLKFYPLVALIIALRERPRVFWIVTAACVAVVAGFVLIYGRELSVVLAAVPHGSYGADVFGAANLWGWIDEAPSKLIGMTMCGLAAVGAAVIAVRLARRRDFADDMAKLGTGERVMLILGSAILAGCFFAGLSIIYRGVYLLLVEAGLLALRRRAGAGLRSTLRWLVPVPPILMWAAALGRGIPAPLWMLREVLWWLLVGALIAILARFAWDCEAVSMLRRRTGAQPHG